MGDGGYWFQSYLTVGVLKLNSESPYQWVFAILGSAGNGSDLYEFCEIDDDFDAVTDEMKARPWECNGWWVWDFDVWSWTELWRPDETMDVDRCDADGNELLPAVTYDEALCFSDP